MGGKFYKKNRFQVDRVALAAARGEVYFRNRPSPWESWDLKAGDLEIPEPCEKHIQASLFRRVQWFLGSFPKKFKGRAPEQEIGLIGWLLAGAIAISSMY